MLATSAPAGAVSSTKATHDRGAVANTGAPREETAHRAYTNAPCDHGHKTPGIADCLSVVATAPDHLIKPNAAAPPPAALGPADIQSAYHLPTSGAGQTVAIVDAYGDSTAEADLATFRSHYGLPPCTNANGCFRKTDQNGGANYPVDDPGWGLETSLDLDAVSAACPKCNILLVEGNTPSVDDLGTAVDSAVALGAKYVSNSYGLADADARAYDDHYNHPGVAITVSSGDVGDAVNWPSSNPNVISVGGTRLTPDASTARGWDETAWAQGGSGCSAYEPKPAYQSANGLDTKCPNRATADISADADPASGLATYDTLGYAGWMQVGGTSLASPLVAAMYALAGPPSPHSYPVANLYDPQHASELYDITEGTNGNCDDLLCQAQAGWDGPTGLGTPNGVAALSEGAHGDIVGQVTDAATGAGIPGAMIATSNGYQVAADSTGHYDLRALADTYDLTVTAYGYASASHAGVRVTDGQTTTVDLALRPVPSSTVSGVVSDGSGHGWPMYAKITIDGYPNGSIFTDPLTGRYSVKLPQEGGYALHVDPVYEPGYVAQTLQLSTGTSDTVTRNVALVIDAATCAAPGYGWKGSSTDFTGWTGATAQDGWSVQGTGHTWEFDNPGYRTAPLLPDGQFAIADSNYYGSGRIDTSLVSPVVDLSAQNAPQLSFNTAYYGYRKGESASVDLSLDGGKTWATVWRQTTANALGHIDLAIPQAAAHAKVRARFHYTASNAWWWGIDSIFIGTHTCVPAAGGIVEGVVSDTAGRPLIGALVASDDQPRQFGVSVATPDDPNLADGYYWVFSSTTGQHPFTVTDADHTAAKATVNVVSNQITHRDWSLTPS